MFEKVCERLRTIETMRAGAGIPSLVASLLSLFPWHFRRSVADPIASVFFLASSVKGVQQAHPVSDLVRRYFPGPMLAIVAVSRTIR